MGGHFAHDLTIRKILQERLFWPILHPDVQHYYITYMACQEIAPRKFTYEPQMPIMSYGLFEKWGIDAIGLLPTTQGGKKNIVMGVDYMTRWVEGIATKTITA